MLRGETLALTFWNVYGARSSMNEDDAMRLAVEAQHQTRRKPRNEAGGLRPQRLHFSAAVLDRGPRPPSSGDGHVLGLRKQIPVYSPREFRELIASSPYTLSGSTVAQDPSDIRSTT